MKKVITAIVIVALAVVFTSIGCKQKKQESTNLYRIAVIPKGTTHIFWKSIHAGAIKAQEDAIASEKLAVANALEAQAHQPAGRLAGSAGSCRSTFSWTAKR